MKRQKIYISISTFFYLFFTLPLFANITSSDNLTLNKHNVKLVGEAQFKVLFWDIYKSRLYTKSGKFEQISPSLIFEITYQKEISKQELIDRTREQWQKMKISETEYKSYIPTLKNLWPDISSGDKLALKVEENGSDFYFNNEYLGSIDNKQFATIFLGIWLAPNTTDPDFRAKLIGGTP